jgi:hypothetical protein
LCRTYGAGLVGRDFGGGMSVYAIAQLWIHDPATYGRYVDRFMGVMEKL